MSYRYILGNVVNKYLFYRNKQLNIFQVRNRNLHTTWTLQKRVAFNLSDIGEGIREVIIKEWFVKEGDTVKQFDNLCEVQSDKASVTITSRYDGKILKLHGKVDEIALVGKPLIDFDTPDAEENSITDQHRIENGITDNREQNEENNAPVLNQSNLQEKAENAFRTEKVLATPAVRRIANENKVNLKEVTPTGKLGRVLKSDVLEYLNVISPSIDSNRTIPIVTEVEIIGGNEDQQKAQVTVAGERIEQLKDVRKIMYKTMTQSLKIPHFVYSDEIDVSELVKLRDELKTQKADLGIKLTFMPFFIKAASVALTKYPILNSIIDEKTESIIFKPSHNISIAMATKSGLVVPNIKNCQTKSIIEIAKELKELQFKGKTGQFKPDDFVHGTFSLSNIGVVGGTYTAPCIVPPQVSIGAIGTVKCVPRFGPNDEIRKVHLVHVSWSADHRVIDGITMAQFSNEWKKLVENPKYFILQ